MAETHDPRPDETATGDPAAGASRPSRTGSVSRLGFDDPTLRPLPPEQLEYHAPHTDAHPERHEHSDVPIRPLAISLVAIAVILAGTFVFLHFLFFHYKGQQDALEVKRTNVPEAKPIIAGPRLQGIPGFSDQHPKDDLKDVRDAYRAELENYGKAGDGSAQVPIDRAMQIALDRGMFKTAQANAGAATGLQGQQQQQGTAPRRQATTQPGQGRGGGGATGGGAPPAGAAPRPRSPQREGGLR